MTVETKKCQLKSQGLGNPSRQPEHENEYHDDKVERQVPDCQPMSDVPSRIG